MQLRSLTHIAEIVVAILHPDLITVLGSSSLLAVAPELGEKGNVLETSLDADFLIEPCDDGKAALIHETLGEGSLFHMQEGVYADIMKSDITSTLPSGWRERCVVLKGFANVICLNPYDLAIVKLQLGRQKDIQVLQALVEQGVISINGLRDRYQKTEMAEQALFKAGRALGLLERDSKFGKGG